MRREGERMGYIEGEARGQRTLFPATLEELIPRRSPVPGDRSVRRAVGDGQAWIFTGRSSRDGTARLRSAQPVEAVSVRIFASGSFVAAAGGGVPAQHRGDVAVGPADAGPQVDRRFRRSHSDAVSQTGAELIRLAREVGLVRGEWVAIDGSKFRAVSSSDSVHERRELERYLERMEQADAEEEIEIDSEAVASALNKLREHPEPEARFMRTPGGKVPA